MKVLLINPKVREWAQPNCFPTGLGIVARTTQMAGHDVNIVDMNGDRSLTEEDLFAEVAAMKPHVIGITGIITQYAEVKRISQICRTAWPEGAIVAGGPLATSVPELLREKTEVDAVVLGEGEFIFVKSVLEYSPERIRTLPLSFSASPARVDTFSPLIPLYEKFLMATYGSNPIAWYNTNKWKDGKGVKNTPPSMNIIGTRGCPYNCIYCYHNFMGQGWRMRNPWDILGEMSYLNRKHNIEYFHFADDAFACSKSKIMKFIQHKGRGNLSGVHWSCAGRANIVDEEMIQAMQESGCVGLCYGLESGSQRMLNAMNKKVTIAQYEKAVELNQKYFEYQDYTFIVGTPGETTESVHESISFCWRMGITPTAVFFMTPYPGTPLWHQLEEQGRIRPKDLGWLEDYVLRLGEQGEQMIMNLTGYPDDIVIGWHRHFQKETEAWNSTKHENMQKKPGIGS